jgi:pimeloyl-ACP methyl ester carboxylesterase
MNRYFILTALVTISLFLAGCSVHPPRHGEEMSSRAEQNLPGDVYLLKGLFNIFSLGMDDIGENLQKKGLKAGVYAGPSWRSLAGQIVDIRGQAEQDTLLVISGHSYGADDSIRLARALNEHDVVVDALVLVDPTTPPKIPANVRRCINIYRSQPATDWMPWLRGVPVEGENQSTLVINRDLRTSGQHEDLLEDVNHFNIEDIPAIQEMVIEEIVAVFQAHQDRITMATPALRERR